ncbi:TPR-like protein [Peniophora sp. CONT]|nr:TPR-like protein [Peniophora sp. CONT]
MATDEKLAEAMNNLSTDDPAARAVELKAVGNKLFAEKKYDEAIKVYGDAIAAQENAVLYCNRAASHLAIQSFGPAAQDAMKSTELDEKYVKAWARLAAAQHGLQTYGKSAASWERALSLVSASDDNPGNAKLREEYKKNLSQAQRLAQKHGQMAQHGMPGLPNVLLTNQIGKKHPWDRAKEMIPRLRRQGITRSSAFVISEASEELEDGFRMLAMVKKQGPMIFGTTGVLQMFCNALIQDDRCFRIDMADFQEKINLQIQMELTQARTPANLLDTDAFIAGIRELHSQGGHDLSCRAMTAGLRTLICRAYLESGMTQKFDNAINLYDKVLRIMRWGRDEWPNASKDDRGAVLEDTYVLGVRRLRLGAYMQAYSNKEGDQYTMQGLLEEAESMLNEVRSLKPLTELLPGFNMAFRDYIEGEALAHIGFYWNHVTRDEQPRTEEAIARGMDNLRKSAKFYFTAAEKFPEASLRITADDERHVWYIKIGLDQLYTAGAPLFITMPFVDKVRRQLPIAQEIWQFSSMNMGNGGKPYDDLFDFMKDVHEMMEKGICNTNVGVSPPWAAPRDVFGDTVGQDAPDL